MPKLNCQATVGCLLKCGDELVLVYEKQHGWSGWDIPAGSIEAGETPEQAIRRELYEEVGLQTADDLLLAKIFWVTLARIPTLHFLYQLNIDSAVVQALRPNTSDIQKIACFAPAEIRKIIESRAYEHELAKARLQTFLEDEEYSPSTICLV